MCVNDEIFLDLLIVLGGGSYCQTRSRVETNSKAHQHFPHAEIIADER